MAGRSPAWGWGWIGWADCYTPFGPDKTQDYPQAEEILHRGYAVPGVREAEHIAGRLAGRNQPCPCGSRKKFKKCCGAPAQS